MRCIDDDEDTVKIDFLILGVLARQPSSGYELNRWIRERGRYHGFKTSQSPIYRTLARLLKSGAIRFEVSESDLAPDAKVYSLTDVGRDLLLEWAHSPFVPSIRPMDPDFMQRFIYGGQLGRDIAIRVIRTELAFRLEQKANDAHDHRTPAGLSPSAIPELDPSWAERVHQFAHERGYASTAQYIAWLELTLAALEREESAALEHLEEQTASDARRSAHH